MNKKVKLIILLLVILGCINTLSYATIVEKRESIKVIVESPNLQN